MVLSHKTDILPAGIKIIKLVAGVEGDKVIVSKYSVTNGVNKYYAPLNKAAAFLDINPESLTGTFTVPKSSLYMIGTFDGSYDSRFFGSINKSQVVGRAYLII